MHLNTVITEPNLILNRVHTIRQPLYILREKQQGYLGVAADMVASPNWEVVALLPAIYPEWLGSQHFLRTHGIRFAYLTGSMANGIATADIVIKMAQAQMLGFFGAAGLSLNDIAVNVARIKTALDPQQLPWGANLIHMPHEPNFEAQIIAFYLANEVTHIEASAFMQVNANLVRYAASGLYRDSHGHIQRKNYIFAKISQPSIAEQFMSPAPEKYLTDFLAQGLLTPTEVELARQVPLAEDITVESDSGGHTDNRPLAPLFSRIKQLSLECMQRYGYQRLIHVGAAGGIGTPTAVAAAFTLGADYVLTGSVNQACVEAGLSVAAKQMLAQAEVTDVIMAPAADMFELGIKLQILKKATFFPGKATRLYEWYSRYPSLEALPPEIITKLEADYFRTSIADIWQQTIDFFTEREPQTLIKAEQNPKHKMALIFRWYLGKSSRWAITGETQRQLDYQIWCGPALGAFNAWSQDSFLQAVENRTVTEVALNLMEGAATLQRVQQVRSCGLELAPSAFNFLPRRLS